MPRVHSQGWKLPDLPPGILAQPKLGTRACAVSCCINVCCWNPLRTKPCWSLSLHYGHVSLLTSLHRITLNTCIQVCRARKSLCILWHICLLLLWLLLLVCFRCLSIHPDPCDTTLLTRRSRHRRQSVSTVTTPFPDPGGNQSPRTPVPSPLSAIPGLGQPCTPWLALPGSIPTTPLRAASRQLRYHAVGLKTFETSRSSWVSVQDVVNTLKDRPRNQVNRSQLSHFYHTQTDRKRCLCSCRYGSCWRVTPWHKTKAELPVDIFPPTLQSDLVTKSL